MFRQISLPKTFSRRYARFIPLRPRPQPLRTLAQGSSIVFGTVALYVSYQLYNDKPVFLPMWISKSKRDASEADVDLKYVKLIAEEQILERLSLDRVIQEEFRLPIKTKLHDDFQVWSEEKDVSLKGIEIKPGPSASLIHRPMRVKPDFEVLMENLGGEDKFEIPVVNSNKVKEEDVFFLGTVTVEGQNHKVADVVFKGIFDSEHIKQARIVKAHLIRTIEGKKTREVLWDC